MGKTKNLKEKRYLKGLDGNLLNLKNIINSIRVELSLVELLNIVLAACIEFIKLIRLNPANKIKKALKRVRIYYLKQLD